MKIDCCTPSTADQRRGGYRGRLTHIGGTALTLVTLLTACGSNGGEPPQPAVTTAPAAQSAPAAAPSAPAERADATKPCTLLSGEAVGKAFNTNPVTATQGPNQTTPDGLDVRYCDYRGKVGSPGVLTVTITGASPVQVVDALGQRTPGALLIPRVGEAAIYYVDRKVGAGVVSAAKAWHGKTIVISYVASPLAKWELITPLVKHAIDVA